MTNETVIQMVKAGFSENVILAKMRSSQTKFDTRTEALIALKQAGTPKKGHAGDRQRRRAAGGVRAGRLGARGLGPAAAAPKAGVEGRSITSARASRWS